MYKIQSQWIKNKRIYSISNGVTFISGFISKQKAKIFIRYSLTRHP